jgi:nucleotide-binding universal stress UspA family protein
MAFRHALSLAQHYRARLFVQHVVELWRYPEADFTPARYYDEFRGHLLHQGEEELQRFVKNNADNEIQPERVVGRGIAADSILALAEAQRVDLIVMGTHGRRGFDRLMVGWSVTERVLRKVSCPVLAVHRPSPDFLSSREQQDPVHLNRILFCTDFSENSERALAYAISLTTEYNAELTLLHVLEDVPGGGSSIEAATATAMEQLEKLIPPEKPKAGKITVRRGSPYQQIIQLALEARTDIVIMAVRGRGALNLAVFGSTTYRVIQLGPCPVLAVHL